MYADAGTEGIQAYKAADRPLYGHMYSVLMPVLGHSSGLWVLLLLTFLALTGIMWFRFLTDLWPRARLRAWLATGLLVVFPGFVQHGIAFSQSQQLVSSFLFVLSLRPGTTLLVQGLPPLLSANQSAGHLNLLYGEAGDRSDLDCLIVDLDHDVARSWGPFLADGEPTEGQLRRFAFAGTTSLAVVAWIPRQGSLRVVGQGTWGEIPGLGDGSRAAARISNPARTLADAPRMPGLMHSQQTGPMLRIRAPEPAHDWAFNFQKAELARDRGDWSVAVDLAGVVTARGLEPVEPSAWLPLVEARLRTGEVPAAAALTKRALARNGHLLVAVESLWNRTTEERLSLGDESELADGSLAQRLKLRR